MYAFLHACVFVFVCVCVCVCVLVCFCACMHIRCICLLVCVCVCVCGSAYVYPCVCVSVARSSRCLNYSSVTVVSPTGPIQGCGFSGGALVGALAATIPAEE